MNITVNEKNIEIDEEGFLVNTNDWTDEVCDALIKQHELNGHKPVSETARGLIDYFVNIMKKIKPTQPCINWF